jgi:ubiquinone/menaquinone biosynthesis C-methylase UbiE
MVPLINPANGQVLQKKGDTYIDELGNAFPIVRGVPRFVTESNYTDSFGFQWNKFQKTQIDTAANLTLSRDRFFAESGWDKEDLTGKDMLEVGSGAGRFSQVVLDHTKANLYSVDYSDAVSANFRNNGHHGERFKLFQASVYEMPFPDNSFDKVFCFGVLQHTPDFKKSVEQLIKKAKPGAEVVVDFYPIKGWWTKVHAKYIFRPITKRWSHEKLLRRIEKNANWMIKTYKFFDKIGINRFIPIVDIKGTLPPNLNKQELREWVILDTFDMFSPEHDHPQRISTVKKWFEEFGMQVTFADYIIFGNNYSAATVKGIKK